MSETEDTGLSGVHTIYIASKTGCAIGCCVARERVVRGAPGLWRGIEAVPTLLSAPVDVYAVSSGEEAT